MKKNVVVIGSNSFSGSDFIDLLLNKGKYDVIGISRSREKNALFLPYKGHHQDAFKFFQCDLIRDYAKLFRLLNRFKPEYIVNYSALSEVAVSWQYPEDYFTINATAVARLGNFLQSTLYLKRYIHISTPEVYGTSTGDVTEKSPLNPSTPYAASKAAGDLMLFTLFKNYRFPLVMIRSTNVYGAHQQLYKIIPRSIIFIKLRKLIDLHGEGKAIKSFIHIRDVSRAVLAAMEKGQIGEIYHVAPDESCSIREIVTKICQKMGVEIGKVSRNVAERPGQDAAYIINSSKLRQTLGWQPRISLGSGLTEVIEWINSNWSDIKKQSLNYIHDANR